jgi:hypothetical protein
MKKTDKKLDNSLRKALIEVCEVALDEVPGFTWLTHLVSYTHFPSSLLVVCVFDTNDTLSLSCAAHKDDVLRSLIHESLAAAGVTLKDIRQHVHFDTEEACQNEHAGKWNVRFASAKYSRSRENLH